VVVKKIFLTGMLCIGCAVHTMAFANPDGDANTKVTIDAHSVRQFFHFLDKSTNQEGIGVVYEGQNISQAKNISDIAGREITANNVNLLKNIPDAAIQNSPSIPDDIQMLAPLSPLTGASQFFAIGFNYKDHAAEFKIKPGSDPTVFFKSIYSISNPYGDLQALTRKDVWLDFEGELGVVVGQNIYGQIDSKEKANAAIAGFITVIDLSDRNAQMNKGGELTKGKSGLDYGPIGPFFVPNDGRIDPTNLEIVTKLNGKVMQQASTKNMIFNVYDIMQKLSPYFPLHQGDIITTGTPLGQIYGHPEIDYKNQASYMKKGDVLEVGIDHLVTQKHTIEGTQ